MVGVVAQFEAGWLLLGCVLLRGRVLRVASRVAEAGQLGRGEQLVDLGGCLGGLAASVAGATEGASEDGFLRTE